MQDEGRDDRLIEELIVIPPRAGLMRRLLYALAGIVCLVALFVPVVRDIGSQVSDGSKGLGTQEPSPPADSQRTAITTGMSDPLLKETQLNLFARSDGALFRIDTRQGRVVEIPNVAVGSGSVDLIVGPDRVLALSGDQGIGVLVTDGQPPLLHRWSVERGQEALPGSLTRPGTFWLVNRRARTVALVTFLGERVSESAEIGSRDLVEDGQGGLLSSGPQGVQQLTSTGWRTLSGGVLAAVGPNHLLLSRCEKLVPCSGSLYDRRDAQKHRLAKLSTDRLFDGFVSPSGRYGAFSSWSWRGNGVALTVVDLFTGRPVLFRVEPAVSGQSSLHQTTLWLRDDRLLGLLHGRIFVLDPASGKMRYSNLPLPPLLQIAVRPIGG